MIRPVPEYIVVRSRILNEAWETVCYGVIDIVANRFRTEPGIIVGRSKQQRHVAARREAILLMAALGMPNKKIAKVLRRDTSTILEYTNVEYAQRKRSASVRRWAESKHSENRISQ